MVLVRRRNAFVNALVRELKRATIEVAGVDRLNLGEELAIQDLLAMARFVLLPQDDLNLACLLKSPLIGLDEDKLFTLAWKRTGHLWRALREQGTRSGLRRGASTARRPGSAAPTSRRRSISLPRRSAPRAAARGCSSGSGHEASDPIDELLARALQYQRSEAASLQGFLRWFEAGGGEIKRDLDANRRPEVRILTVHASKGLQAPIVYLPDTTRVPRDTERLLADADGETRLWLPRADDASDAARAWRDEVRERTLEEQNRLLYVAMTRAEDRLYVGGWVGARKQDKGCWYDRIAGGLQASVEGESPIPRRRATARTFDFTRELGTEGWTGEGFELVNEGRIEAPAQAELALEADGRRRRLDQAAASARGRSADSARSVATPARRDAVRASRLQPVGAGRPTAAGSAAACCMTCCATFRRCRRPIAPMRARRFLAQPGHGLSAEEIESWTAEALAVTEAAAHAALFAEGSRAEVPLIGTVKTRRGTFTVSGQVDRLAVTDSEVLIVDYKTNRPPPDATTGVALAYRRQLALYRALLGRDLSGSHGARFSLVDSDSAVDGNRRENA